MYDEPIILLKKIGNTVTDAGDTIPEYEEREVFAEVKSITMSESYKAFASDIDARYVFELADYLDYENEELFKYNEKIYSLVRTYRVPGKDTLEIVVKSNDNTE
ncbi:MAG: phage head closure protein [Acetivibrio ethanolgignens]